MVYFERIPEDAKEDYPDADRLMVFEGQEFPLIKLAAVIRKARRIVDGTEEIPLDRYLLAFPDSMPALATD
jgi:hypothetical protein